MLSSGDDGWKYMELGKKHARQVFVDCLSKIEKEITLDKNGGGEFLCLGGSVSVWVNKKAMEKKALRSV